MRHPSGIWRTASERKAGCRHEKDIHLSKRPDLVRRGRLLAEILTGTSFAPLGMAKGLAAILIGHIIGCAMMLLAGLIGGRTGRSAMETVKMSFGQKEACCSPF